MAYPRQQKRREFYTFPAMKIFLVRRQITYRSHLVDLWLKSCSVRQSDEQEKLFFVSFFSLFIHESLVSSFYRLLCASTLLTCLSGLPCVFVRFLSLIIIFVLFLDIQLKQLHINRLNFRFYFYSNSLQLVIKLQPFEHLDQTSAIVLCLSYFVYFLQLPGLRS